MTRSTQSGPKSQSDKFKEAAREHEADENEARWEKRLRKVAKGDQKKVDQSNS